VHLVCNTLWYLLYILMVLCVQNMCTLVNMIEYE
jgi:hypothetical protein